MKCIFHDVLVASDTEWYMCDRCKMINQRLTRSEQWLLDRMEEYNGSP